MARYIDADKAKHEFNIGFGGVSHAVIANQIIDSVPTADVVEVKHGYWYEIDSDVGWDLVGCSICRREYSLCDGEDRTDYCPYCGAKMDGGNHV